MYIFSSPHKSLLKPKKADQLPRCMEGKRWVFFFLISQQNIDATNSPEISHFAQFIFKQMQQTKGTIGIQAMSEQLYGACT